MCIILHHILFSEESKNQHIPEHLLQIGISQRKTAFIQTYLDAFYLPYSLDKVQINCMSRSLLKPDEEILKTCTLWSVRLLRIKLGYPKLASFQHVNQHTQRKFVYIAPKDRGETSKIGHFQNSRSIFKVFYQLNLPANNFHLRISNQRNNFY